MTFKCLVKAVRAAILLSLAIVFTSWGLHSFAQDSFRQDRKDVTIEHRLTTVEVGLEDLAATVKEMKQDMGQVKYYGVAILIGVAALLGEKGLQLTGIEIFKKDDKK